MINDTYLVNSINEGLRRGRGKSGQQVYVQGFDQHMLEGEQWDEFLHSDTNKEQLINVIKEYITSNEGNEIYEFPIIVTTKSKTYKISFRTTTEQFECNHEEADSRLVLHATLEDTAVVIVSKDIPYRLKKNRLKVWSAEILVG